MGRQSKPAADTYSRMIRFRVTPDQGADLERRVAESGMDRSAYLRGVLFPSDKPTESPADALEIELNEIMAEGKKEDEANKQMFADIAAEKVVAEAAISALDLEDPYSPENEAIHDSGSYGWRQILARRREVDLAEQLGKPRPLWDRGEASE